MDTAGLGRRRRRRARVAIGLFIQGVAGVSFDPFKFDLALGDLGIELFPQVDILLAFPFKVHGLDDVLAIATKNYAGAGGNHPQSFDCAGQFHAIVGGGGVAAIDSS